MIGWGFLVVSGVDNVLRPYLISRGSRLPLILMFFGVLGGLLAFGFLGVFLGPTLLAIGYVLFQEWSSAPRSATNEVAAEVAPAPLVQPRAAEGSSACDRPLEWLVRLDASAGRHNHDSELP